MIEFIKDGLGLIASVVLIIFVFLLLLGYEERKKKGEPLIIKNQINTDKENEQGCLSSISSGIIGLVLIIILISSGLFLIWLIIKAATYPSSN